MPIFLLSNLINNAVISTEEKENKSHRDHHIDFIDAHGRPFLEFMMRYNRRLLVDNGA